jgi:glyoxylase-like metal-dependent hydrolase (beta-lactamase superfamily II)
MFGATAYADEHLVADNVAEVADGVYAFYPDDAFGSLFIVTDDGVIAIEPANTQHATGFLEAIKSITDQPVKYLLLSHNHWDHANGGGVFREAGAQIIAHEKAHEWMKANPHPDLALPNESWSGSRKDITLGGTTLELHYLGPNHGLGLTVFLLPKEKVVYIADLITPNSVMFTIAPDFNIKEWVRSLSEIETLDFDKAVFSHSQSGSPIGSKQDVVAFREYITDLQGAIVAEFQKGTNPFAIPSIVRLPKYKDWGGYDEWLEMNAWRVMLDMWMGPFPWQS